MAKAIQQIEKSQVTSEETDAQNREALLALLFEQKDSIEKSIQLLRRMDDRGILDFVTALVGQGDKVMGVVARGLNKPHNTAMLIHSVKLAEIVGELEIDKVQLLISRVNRGLVKAEEAASCGQMTSIFDLLKAFKDPDVNRAITALIGFLKGAGQSEF